MNPFSLGSALFEIAARAASDTVNAVSNLAYDIVNDIGMSDENSKINTEKIMMMMIDEERSKSYVISIGLDSESKTLDGTLLEGKDGTIVRLTEVTNIDQLD